MRTIVLTLMLCLGASLHASGIRFVVEGKQWNYIGYYYGVPPEDYKEWTYYYRLSGDTIVGGVPCKKLYYNMEENEIHVYSGAMYEKGGKVHFFPANHSESMLLYDFGCSVGDNLVVMGEEPVTITGIQDVVFENTTYRVVCAGQPYNTWIEGIGSKFTDLLTSTLDSSVNGARLVSCEQNGHEIFNHEAFWRDGKVVTDADAIQYIEAESVANNSNIYDLSGRRLSSVPVKGVYIQNGKKVLVK